MNHLPFETWLLSEDTLPPEQARQLREHLLECEACRKLGENWAGVRQLFNTVPPAKPVVGFAARWKERQAAERQRRERRQTWSVLIFTGGTASILFLAWWVRTLVMLDSLQGQLQVWASRLLGLLIYADAAQDLLVMMARSLLPAIPISFWIFFPGFVSLVMVLWIAALKQITFSRRIVS